MLECMNRSRVNIGVIYKVGAFSDLIFYILHTSAAPKAPIYHLSGPLDNLLYPPLKQLKSLFLGRGFIKLGRFRNNFFVWSCAVVIAVKS